MKWLYVLTTCLVAFVQAANAQFSIDGQKAVYDSLTNTYMATVPQSVFHHDHEAMIGLDAGWYEIFIDYQKTANKTFRFKQIEANKNYPVTLISNTGERYYAQLTFTFLPIVQLKGNFSNDYTPATVRFADPYVAGCETLHAQVKWRGGTTNGPDRHKRNYKIKLDDDYAFLGMRNDNNWILDAGQKDLFRFRNLMANDLWSDFVRQPYYIDEEPKARLSIRGAVVEVFLNNAYAGLYNLSENIDRKQAKVKKIDKDTGAVRGCLYKAKGWLNSRMYNPVTPYDNSSETWDAFEVKYPDLADSDTTDWSTLCEAIAFVHDSNNSIFFKQVADYFDLPIVADYWVFGSVLNPLDNAGKNVFWAVHDKNIDRKLTLAVWDLDCCMGQRWQGEISERLARPDTIVDMKMRLTDRLVRNNLEGFNDDINARYAEAARGIFAADSLIARVNHYYALMDHSGARLREEQRWSGDSDIAGEILNIEAEKDYICDWITQHIRMINTTRYAEALDIRQHFADADDSSATVYDLRGRRFSADEPLAPGIYIKNHRKVVIKRP